MTCNRHSNSASCSHSFVPYKGAVTGSEDVWVMDWLYADDLTLLANAPDAMGTMQNRLVVYARSKQLTINTAKSGVVHLN